MTDAAAPEETPKKSRKWVVIVGALAVVGLGAGFAAPILLAPNASSASVAAPAAQENPQLPLMVDHQVGRITVALRQGNTEAKKRHMVLDLIVRHHGIAAPSGDPDAKPGDQLPSELINNTILRDSFIEYLTQVTESEISGTSGLNNLRAELLRRAIAVAPELKPEAILIQDLIIQ